MNNIAALAPVLSAILIIGGLGAVGYGLYRYYIGTQSYRWKKVQGSIVRAETRQISENERINQAVSGDKYAVKLYFVSVTYQYQVGGKTYTNNALKPGETAIGVDSAADGKRIAAKFPPGTPVTVFAKPANPAQSVLQPNSDLGSLVFFGILGGVSLVLGVLFAIMIPQMQQL
jgi:hypothetical protein